MPFDIIENSRLRNTWYKYQHILAEMNGYYNKKEFIQNQMDTNKLSRWEATLAFEEEIKKVERQCREEMNQIHKQVIAERKKMAELFRIREEEEERERQAVLEKRRKARELRKEQLKNSPPPLRRSARVHSKTSNDPLAKYRCGSMYTKTA